MNLPEPMQAVLRAIDCIETHLAVPVTVPDIARCAGYSAGHFCAVFNRYTRHSPYDYLIRRRMSQAAQDLVQQPDCKVIDIALNYQFESHEGFTRAFHRMLGLCPGEVQSTGYFPYQSFLPPLTAKHLVCLVAENGLMSSFLPAIPVNANERIPAMEIPTWLKSDSPIDRHFQVPIRYAMFHLSDENNLPYLLDWVCHTWMFLSALILVQNRFYLLHEKDQCQVLIPVGSNH